MKIISVILPFGAFADIMPPAAEPDGKCCQPELSPGSILQGCDCDCACQEATPVKKVPPAPPTDKLTLKEKVGELDQDLKLLTDRFAAIGREIEVTGEEFYADFPPVATFSDALDYLSTRVRVLSSLARSIESKLGIR